MTGKALTFKNPFKNCSKNPYSPSIDRIDSRIGYTKSNCRIVCVAANYAMNEWGDSVLRELALSMVHAGRLCQEEINDQARIESAKKDLMPPVSAEYLLGQTYFSR